MNKLKIIFIYLIFYIIINSIYFVSFFITTQIMNMKYLITQVEK